MFHVIDRGAVILLVLMIGSQDLVSAQVVEEREGESNPATVIFHSTLYGAGTGLVLGGAYALVEEDEDVSTGDILKWGTAGGAAVGFLIGFVYVMVRPEPEGDAEVVSLVKFERGDARLAAPTVQVEAKRDFTGKASRTFSVHLVNVRF